MSTVLPPEGWFVDPDDLKRERYWTGAAWDHRKVRRRRRHTPTPPATDGGWRDPLGQPGSRPHQEPLQSWTSPADERAAQQARIVCQHCQTAGHVTTRLLRKKGATSTAGRPRPAS